MQNAANDMLKSLKGFPTPPYLQAKLFHFQEAKNWHDHDTYLTSSIRSLKEITRKIPSHHFVKVTDYILNCIQYKTKALSLNQLELQLNSPMNFFEIVVNVNSMREDEKCPLLLKRRNYRVSCAKYKTTSFLTFFLNGALYSRGSVIKTF